MNTVDILRHKAMLWGSLLSLFSVAAGLFWLHYARTGLSSEVFDDAMAACKKVGSAPDTCRERVETFHDDCYRWALTRHDEYPEIDQEKYEDCLAHPPGKFRDSEH